MINQYDGRKFNVDVLVCGGGVAGCSAAITAARRGLRVLLLEREITLGGLATNNYVNGIAGQVEGMSRELMDRCVAEGIGLDRPHLPVFDPDKTKLLLERMVTESGGRILYGIQAIDTVMDGDSIARVQCVCKSGMVEIAAKIFVDATGDGDVAAAAGAPYEEGSPEFFGLSMSSTLAFRMGHVDFARYNKACGEWAGKYVQEHGGMDIYGMYQYLEQEAVKNGDLPYYVFPTALMYPIPGYEPNDTDISVMTCHSFYNHNTDVQDLTRQVVEQHNQMAFLEKFYQKYLPGFERAKINGIGSIFGVRDSRRIIGDYVFKAADICAGTKFEDGIVRFPEFYDVHHPTSPRIGFKRHIHLKEPMGTAILRNDDRFEGPAMHPFGTPLGTAARPDARNYCEIPFRALVPQKVENLLLAGRCVSAEFDSCGGVRVIAPSMGTGQAAAVAADVCIRQGIRVHDIDPKSIRRRMIEEEHVPLDKPCDGYWAELASMEGDQFVNFTDSMYIKKPDGSVMKW